MAVESDCATAPGEPRDGLAGEGGRARAAAGGAAAADAGDGVRYGVTASRRAAARSRRSQTADRSNSLSALAVECNVAPFPP